MTSLSGIQRTSKTGLIFALGVFLPSAILAWLALRTLGEQQIILERQTAALSQSETDLLASEVQTIIETTGTAFTARIESLLQNEQPWELARDFGSKLENLPAAATAFSLSPGGQLISPTTQPGNQKFLRENASFLSNQIQTEVYQAHPQTSDPSIDSPGKKLAAERARPMTRGLAVAADESKAKVSSGREPDLDMTAERRTEKQGAAPVTVRKVIPQNLQQEIALEEPQPTSFQPQLSDFRSAVSGLEGGILARFVQDHLELIVWARPPSADEYIFGYMLPATALGKTLQETLALPENHPENGDVLAILNEKAEPVATSDPAFGADWKRPFVATEVGEILPFWEVALYLRNPERIDASAQTIRLTLGSFIALALGAITVAGWLVVRDTRRQLALAQKKADFVSNVSHELKTPLTSIRMFAELLERNNLPPAKRAKYLHIINAESERLSRLINHVLDFARIEKKRKTYSKEHLDLYPVIERLWETQEAHLSEAGYHCQWISSDPPWPLFADPDAIARALINLLSNAEKYGGETRDVTLQTWKEDGHLRLAVLDSGPGIPANEARKIFEPFYRTNHSLASETQGSGLGLTLSRKIVEDHGGTLTYEARSQGGSRFTISLPLETNHNNNPEHAP